MNKVVIYIEEKVTYRTSVTFEVPDETREEDVSGLLVAMEKVADSREGVVQILNGKGYKIVHQADTDYSSPESSEIEIDEYEFEEIELDSREDE